MKCKLYYRIFDDLNGTPATLFHGVNGSRKLPLDEWVDATVKPVTDGSGVTVYQSGFHVITDLKETKKFLLKRFKHIEKRVIARVEVDEDAGTWPKSHSPHPVLLVKRMRIKKADWARRVRFTELSRSGK